MQNEMPAPSKKVVQTGPRTPAGKAVASRNAISHGIMAPHPGIIEGLETEEEWDRHIDGIVTNLAPEGALEEELADRLATLLWRLRRVTRYETAVINHQVSTTRQDLIVADSYLAPTRDDIPDPAPLRVAAHKEKRVIPSDAHVDKIMRYETHIHRQPFRRSTSSKRCRRAAAANRRTSLASTSVRLRPCRSSTMAGSCDDAKAC